MFISIEDSSKTTYRRYVSKCLIRVSMFGISYMDGKHIKSSIVWIILDVYVQSCDL